MMCLQIAIEILTFIASKIIDTPLSSAGILYRPNASCGIDNLLGVVNDGSVMLRTRYQHLTKQSAANEEIRIFGGIKKFQ